MKATKRIVSCIIMASVVLVLLVVPLQAGAAQGPALSAPAQLALDWLAANVTDPSPQDALAVFTLLRGGTVPADSGYAQGYIQTIKAHAQGGGAASQGAELNAWQALALAAAGADVQQEAPALLEQLQLAAADDGLLLQDKCYILLALHPSGAAQADTAALAENVAYKRLLNGGFGTQAVADALATAQAMQALSLHSEVAAAQSSLSAGIAWLQANQASFGGYNQDGAPSAAATAQAVLALACTAAEAPGGAGQTPAEALLVFQNEDGSFSANPDSPPDTYLSALCALALTADARQQAGLPGVFTLTDVGSAGQAPQPGSGSSAGTAAPTQSGGQQAGGLLQQLTPWVYIAAAAGLAIVVLVIILALASGGRKKKKPPPAQSQSTRAHRYNPGRAPSPTANVYRSRSAANGDTAKPDKRSYKKW